MKITLQLTALALVALVFSSNAIAQNANPTSTAVVGRPAGMDPSESTRLEETVRSLLGPMSPRSSGDTLFRVAEDLYKKAAELERAGKIQEALSFYDQSLRANPEDPRTHIALGRLLERAMPALSLYHYQSAFRYAIGAKAQEAPEIEVLRRFLVGRYLSYALPIEDPVTSAKLLELAVSLAPEDPRIHAHLSMAYFFQGYYERSIFESRNALALGLDDGLIHTNIAAAFAQLGKKEEAEAEIRIALERDELDINEALNAIRRSNEADSLMTLNRLLGSQKLQSIMENSTKGRLEAALRAWNTGDSQTALKFAEEAVAGNPEHSYSLIVLGDFKRGMSDTAGAAVAYKIALDRNPNNELANPRLGDLAFAEKNYGEAAEYYTKAMDLMSGRLERIDILDRTAVALAQQKKHDQALTLLDKWLRANPNAPEAFEISVRKAGILEDAQRGPQAEVLLKNLIERDKTNPAGYTVLHNYYTKHGEVRKANQIVNDGIIRLQAARDQQPLNPEYYRDLARLYRLIGKEPEARTSLWEGGLRTSEKRYFANSLFVIDAETQAFDVLKAWIAAEPRNPEAILSFGWVSAKLKKDMDQALAYVNQLARDNASADMAPIQRTRGFLYHSMGQHEKAIGEIKAFLKSDQLPQADFFHRIWGLSAEALNQRAEAIKHFNKAIELDPEANADLGTRCSALEAQTSAVQPAASTPAQPAAAPAPAARRTRRTR